MGIVAPLVARCEIPLLERSSDGRTGPDRTFDMVRSGITTAVADVSQNNLINQRFYRSMIVRKDDR